MLIFETCLGSKLVITQIIPEDDAIYQCLAENQQGSVLSLARLIVVMSEDRPSAPRNIHAEAVSSSAVLLAWEKPLYNADKVIAYSIHYTKAEGKRRRKGLEPPTRGRRSSGTAVRRRPRRVSERQETGLSWLKP